MARLPRPYFPGCAQHVIQRGNNRQACFYQEARINGVSVIDS
jgi:putative transposase